MRQTNANPRHFCFFLRYSLATPSSAQHTDLLRVGAVRNRTTCFRLYICMPNYGNFHFANSLDSQPALKLSHVYARGGEKRNVQPSCGGVYYEAYVACGYIAVIIKSSWHNRKWQLQSLHRKDSSENTKKKKSIAALCKNIGNIHGVTRH